VLKDAGLSTLPGTAAEVLDDEVRAVICPDKVNTEEWLEAHRLAHGAGLRSNVTIMFGTVERPEHVARHLLRTRDLQKETGGFTALEVTEGAKRLGEPLADYLKRLMAAGLKTLPGTAAEILDDEIRAILCPDKVNTEEWLDAHRTAHSVGLRSNITIMFGSVEQPVHWARHLIRTRDLQLETGGFTEFVPLPFVHMASPIYLQHKSRRGPTFRETLLMHAVGRIAYGDLVPNVQVSWVKIGAEGGRQILQAGANDLGGTLMDENISRAAGAAHGQLMDEDGFHEIADPLGRPLEQRTTLYGRVPTPA
jgi:FO synthase